MVTNAQQTTRVGNSDQRNVVTRRKKTIILGGMRTMMTIRGANEVDGAIVANLVIVEEGV